MRDQPSSLGAFSISLAVNDLAASREFYSKLGFAEIGGNAEQNWLIIANGSATIGLFQGMFDSNIITFNPGWDASGNELESFTDARVLRRELEASGVEIKRADGATEGPTSFVIADPDGNTILLDQHV